MNEPIATHEDVTTIMGILGDIRDETQRTREILEDDDGEAEEEQERPWTAEDEARRQRTTKLVEERMAYHSEMSRLLGEREREQRRLDELRRAARMGAGA